MADKFELPNVLLALRNELEQAQFNAEKAKLKFSLEEIELEVQVTVSAEAEAKGGVKFWVYEADASGKVSKETVHTVRLKMKPEQASGEPLKVSGQTSEPD